MPHLISTAYTTAEEQPESFEVTIDVAAPVTSTAQTLGDGSVRLYFDLATYTVSVSHDYSIIATHGVFESAPVTGSFTISPWRSLYRK